ncbi:MAG: radical SAM protein [Gammaproteobacteria bacterium]|nr:radical SAM protein [Gammaproteobacteria bacterium]
MTYIYPVISRRAGGLSIGINLNTNNACNWRCVYCQVPNLQRGTAPAVNLELLHDELLGFLTDLADGSYFEKAGVPAEYHQIRDIAISGNGEATSAAGFAQVVDIIGQVRSAAGIDDTVKTVLITNGSLVQRQSVRAGIAYLSRLNGEIWFKLDAATHQELKRLNGTHLSPGRVFSNLKLTATLCMTWIQTCAFALDGAPAADRAAYLDFIRRIVHERIPVAGVHLYGLARPSMQEEAGRLSALPPECLQEFAEAIEHAGLRTRLSP